MGGIYEIRCIATGKLYVGRKRYFIGRFDKLENAIKARKTEEVCHRI
jgi:hypothetical protein